MVQKKKSLNYDGTHVKWDDRHVRSPRAAFGQVVYEPAGFCGPRIQKDIEFVLLHHGACDVLVDGKARVLKPGMVYLFLPQHREEFRFSAEIRTHHSWCSFRPDLPDDALRHALVQAPVEATLSPLFEKLLADAFLIGPVQGEISERVVECLALAVGAEYLAMTRSPPGTAGADPCVVRALRHMEDHYSQADCLGTTHAMAGCSRNALISRFVRVTDLTPDSYLWRLRTQKGIAMLSATGLPVAEIADRCGFQSPFHFSRLVKKLQGCSPRETRARSWAAPSSKNT